MTSGFRWEALIIRVKGPATEHPVAKRLTRRPFAKQASCNFGSVALRGQQWVMTTAAARQDKGEDVPAIVDKRAPISKFRLPELYWGDVEDDRRNNHQQSRGSSQTAISAWT